MSDMWSTFVSKFYALLFSVVLFFTSLSVAIPGFCTCAKLDYRFDNDVPGSAAGTVTVTATVPGTYDLYWGADEETRLTATIGDEEVPYTGFAEAEVCSGTGSTDIYEFIAIPEGAETVLAYRGALLVGSTQIPEEKQAPDETPLFTFGALSDVHFNRYNLSLTGDDACLAFPNALDTLQKAGVSLVGLSGDISTKGETDSFEKYGNIIGNYDFPILTCTGNHDVGYDTPWFTDWQAYVNPALYGGDPQVSDIAGNGLDFVYTPAGVTTDVFVFLSQIDWDYNRPESRILDDAQLDWLETVLEKYKDRSVYLFFHTFLADDEGNIKTGEGNMVNSADEYYDLVYTVGTPDEVRFRSLLQQYKNVVFFNGHSHWVFESFAFNPRVNITDYNGTYCTLVHIPSVSSPRSTRENQNGVNELFMRSSQGYLVNVYADRIELRGLEFWGTRFVSCACFNIAK
ncbi:MAG: metallophosphoesterase [Clostridia bacterium]|nr:metallophosphoesterase [Clostridia bacterium]